MTALRIRILAVMFGAALVCGFAEPITAASVSPVAVSFIAPERYTDANNRSGSATGLKGTLSEIRYILVTAASRVIGPGDTLRVDVLDIDLAGFAHPGFATPTGPRLVSDVTPPAFRLRYELRRGGRRIASGEERVTDINFLFGDRANRSGTFAYEEELLRDWARRRLSSRQALPTHDGPSTGFLKGKRVGAHFPLDASSGDPYIRIHRRAATL